MASIRTGRTARRLAVGFASGGLVLLTAVGVHAQEGGFLEMLFGGARPAPAQPALTATIDPYRQQRRARSERHRERVARKAPTRYVALPRAEEDGISGKQPVDQKAILDDPKGVLLKDPTLRAGDIVVMPSGPKVFKGAEAQRHRMSDFEDVRHSRFLDRKTRAQLVAMMVPVGAMTPEQARKVMSVKLKLASPDEVQAVEAANATPLPAEAESAGSRPEPATPRVIAPWTPRP